MTVESTIVAKMWVGGDLVLDLYVEDRPATIYHFAVETWTTLVANPKAHWVIELSVPMGDSPHPPPPSRWQKGDMPTIGKLGHVPDVVHRYVELRQRAILGEGQERDDDQ